MWDRRAEYVDHYDGDSVTVVLDQGFHDNKEIHLRLANVWAPEMDEEGGIEVRQFVADWFKSRDSVFTRWNFIVWTHRMKRTDREQKTFDRYVATVTSADGKDCLNSDVMEYIVNQGYEGGIGS